MLSIMVSMFSIGGTLSVIGWVSVYNSGDVVTVLVWAIILVLVVSAHMMMVIMLILMVCYHMPWCWTTHPRF